MAKPSYEEARDELAKVVSALEAGGVGLERLAPIYPFGRIIA